MFPIANELALDAAQQGWLFSAFSWGYVFFMLPGGLLVRRIGPWRCLLGGVLVSSLLSFCLIFTKSFAGLFCLRFMLGAAEAPVFPACAAIVACQFKRGSYGWATAAFDAGSYAGGAVVIGWRPAFIVPLIPLVVVLFANWSRQLGPMSFTESSAADTKPLQIRLLLDVRVIGLALSFMCYNFSKSFYLTWLPTLFAEFKDFDVFWLTLLSTSPFILAMAFDFLGAWILDNRDRCGYNFIASRRALIFGGSLCNLLVATIFWSDSKGMTVTVAALSFAGLIATSSAYWSLPRELSVSSPDVPIVGAFINFISNAGGILSPLLIGSALKVSSKSAMPKIGLLLGASALLGAGFACFVKPQKGQGKSPMS
jgi:ACS family glucarate transporter-like MFS transporter